MIAFGVVAVRLLWLAVRPLLPGRFERRPYNSPAYTDIVRVMDRMPGWEGRP